MITASSHATFQEGDILIYRNDSLSIPVFPLENYPTIKENEIKLMIEQNTHSTGNYRGYVAVWKIEENKLWIVDIKAWIDTGMVEINKNEHSKEMTKGFKKATLIDLFKDKVKNDKVHANWFSGKIFYPGSRWGQDLRHDEEQKQLLRATLIITIRNGIVEAIKDYRKTNKK